MSQGRTGSVQLKQLTQEGWRLPPLLHFNKDSHNQGFCVVVAATDSAGCAKSYDRPDAPIHRKRGGSMTMTLDRDLGRKHIISSEELKAVRLRSSVDWRLNNSARRALDVMIELCSANGTVEMSYAQLVQPCENPLPIG
jgi:hypothetical protein